MEIASATSSKAWYRSERVSQGDTEYLSIGVQYDLSTSTLKKALGRPEGLVISMAPSERSVRPVAEGRGLGLLAHAQSHFFRFIYCKLDRLDPSSLMTSVTEGLVP
jgi:hypothetical protein